MKLIKPYYIIEDEFDSDEVLKKIEKIGRVCYKSESMITEESAKKFVKKLIDNKHEAVIEHFSFSVKFICDRGISHEIVRHRLASYAQESTRYCNYSKDKFNNELTFILPCWLDKQHTPVGNYKYTEDGMAILVKPEEYDEYEIYHSFFDEDKTYDQIFIGTFLNVEQDYLDLIGHGFTPQQARSILPNSLKTEVVMTANLREWRHFFRLRTHLTAHPQMRELTIPLLKELKEKIPVVFDDVKLKDEVLHE